MSPATLRLAFRKQRAINRHLQEQLRAETMLTTALSDLRWHKRHQTPVSIERLRHALAHKQAITTGTAPATTFYPTGRHAA